MEPGRHDAEQARPLDPMPVAGREKVLDWLGRIRTGAWVYLALGLLGAAFYLSWRPWSESPADVLPTWLTQAVQATVGLVALWLVTTPEPENSSWLRRRRWVTRVGMIVVWLGHAVLAMLGKVLAEESQQILSVASTAHGLVWMILIVLAGSYYRELADRLRDTALRKNVTILLVIVSVFAALAIPALLIQVVGLWSGSGATEPSVANERDPAHPMVRNVLMVILLCGYAWTAWMSWRLARTSGKVARVLSPANEDSAPADDTSG